MTCIIETDAPTIAYVYSAAPNFPTPWCIRDIPHSPKHDGLAVAVHGMVLRLVNCVTGVLHVYAMMP